MLLAIDVGNTHTVIGLFEENSLLAHWRIKTDRQKTADEIAAIFFSLFSMQGFNFAAINDVIVASVVPTQQAAWKQFAQNTGWRLYSVRGRELDTGLEIRIDNPAEVGADRIVNSVAAYARYQCALIVVDFGTAITFDCVSADCAYIGGAITPGLSIAHEALANRTAKLPRVDLTIAPQKAIGTNTADAIRSGLLFGYGGLVDNIINKLKDEFPDRPKVIATGGMAELIAPYSNCIEETLPMLTLEGLQIIHARNHDRPSS